MREERLDLWVDSADAKCITTNGVVKEDGTLVMGAGTAGDMQSRYPDAPKILGGYVSRHGNHLYVLYFDKQYYLSFPTKDDWRDDSNLGLIKQSSIELMQWLNDNPHIKTVFLPRPGCGLGLLDWETQVKPAIEPILDDRVIVIHNGLGS